MIPNHAALLVIDMQKGSFTPVTPRYDTDGVVNRINRLAKAVRSAERPVVFIQHDGSSQGEFIPGNTDWELLDELEVKPADIIVPKTANDSFYQTTLRKQLDETSTTHLLISGCATDFCVESTVQSALSKRYELTIVGDAHTTADRPHVSAEKLIEHYNWAWQNMLPTAGGVQVVSAAELLD